MEYYAKAKLDEYPICILTTKVRADEIKREYLDPFGIPDDLAIMISLHQSEVKKKTPVKEMKEYVQTMLVPALENVKPTYLVVGDSEYFKILTGLPKADSYIGYVVDAVDGPWKVVYVPNYQMVFYDPVKIRNKIKTSMDALYAHYNGTYTPPGDGIIKSAAYPDSIPEIKKWLDDLLAMDCDLTVDIEGFSLKPYACGIATICFCWDEHNGIAFPVDYSDNPALVRALLRRFFEKFRKRLIFHNIAFDASVLIYQLYMKHIIDTRGLLRGLKHIMKNWEDTKLIAYLATNSCAGNKLSLKDQAQEFAGNYALTDIDDIRKIPLDQLLEYNLVDGLSTWHVYKKHWDTVIKDNQLEIYEQVFKPATVDIVQMQLTGIPLSMPRVKEVKTILSEIRDIAVNEMNLNPKVQEFVYVMNEEWVREKNLKLKKKRVTLADANETFNPGSSQQLQRFLHEFLELPILETTDSGLASTEAKILRSLKNHTTDPEIQGFLESLLSYKAVAIILSTFIPAFEDARAAPDGWHYLIGNFNLGGTVSGRLSSSNPNLQNLPSNASMIIDQAFLAKYPLLSKFTKKGSLSIGKLVKYCFCAPPGWLFCGIDFNSLEDRISALTTKDPNKLKVYTDGYDGHCLRAYSYFTDRMPDIDPNSVDSINSIANKYPVERQDSKAPTFALTYQGTYKTLMKNCGFSESLALQIEQKYHELYRVSDEWVAAHLDKASKVGYVEAAFGLRIRTPLLAQVIRGTRKTPHEAEAEGRTAGNALGQSWCLLNSRAGSGFMSKVRRSKYATSIRPCAQIHDAQYYLVRDNVKVLKYANDNVVAECEWQEHPLIAHDEVKLGGEFSIFYPDWSSECALPNRISESEIIQKVSSFWEEYLKKAA